MIEYLLIIADTLTIPAPLVRFVSKYEIIQLVVKVERHAPLRNDTCSVPRPAHLGMTDVIVCRGRADHELRHKGTKFF